MAKSFFCDFKDVAALGDFQSLALRDLKSCEPLGPAKAVVQQAKRVATASTKLLIENLLQIMIKISTEVYQKSLLASTLEKTVLTAT